MIRFNSKSKDKWVKLSNMWFDGECGGFWVKDKVLGRRVWMINVEMFFCFCKSLRKEDREKVIRCRNGFECRKVGRRVELRDGWDGELKVEVMRWGLKRKFKNKELKELLLSSGDEVLVEDSKWDGFWGCGRDGKGKNMLGKLLMELRSELRG